MNYKKSFLEGTSSFEHSFILDNLSTIRPNQLKIVKFMEL